MAKGDWKGAIKPFLIGFAATAAAMLLSNGADAGGSGVKVECTKVAPSHYALSSSTSLI